MRIFFAALAIAVAVSAVPFNVSPAWADDCEIASSGNVFSINAAAQSWKLIVDGATYTSEKFDKFKKKSNKKTQLFRFKDKSNVTRTPNNDGGIAVSVSLAGEINETDRSGSLSLRDKTNGRDYSISDGSNGPKIECG